jgi:hypothetical protein
MGEIVPPWQPNPCSRKGSLDLVYAMLLAVPTSLMMSLAFHNVSPSSCRAVIIFSVYCMYITRYLGSIIICAGRPFFSSLVRELLQCRPGLSYAFTAQKAKKGVSRIRSPEAAVPCSKATVPHSMQISFGRFPFALTLLKASVSLFDEGTPQSFFTLLCAVASSAGLLFLGSIMRRNCPHNK